MINPIEKPNSCIQDSMYGAPNPKQAILSIIGFDGNPQSRVAATKPIANPFLQFFMHPGWFDSYLGNRCRSQEKLILVPIEMYVIQLNY